MVNIYQFEVFATIQKYMKLQKIYWTKIITYWCGSLNVPNETMKLIQLYMGTDKMKFEMINTNANDTLYHWNYHHYVVLQLFARAYFRN